MNDDQLDSLLARGVLSGPQRDRVLERVLREVEGPARGESAPEAVVDVECTAGTLRACPHGAHLLFHSSKAGYLAAYADPVGGGERIVYFSAEGDAPFVGAPSAPDRPADRVVVVGPEHQRGDYDVHVVLGSRPLSIAEAHDVRTPVVIASQILRLTVTE
jgi:hypothetical protein